MKTSLNFLGSAVRRLNACMPNRTNFIRSSDQQKQMTNANAPWPINVRFNLWLHVTLVIGTIILFMVQTYSCPRDNRVSALLKFLPHQISSSIRHKFLSSFYVSILRFNYSICVYLKIIVVVRFII